MNVILGISAILTLVSSALETNYKQAAATLESSTIVAEAVCKDKDGSIIRCAQYRDR